MSVFGTPQKNEMWVYTIYIMWEKLKRDRIDLKITSG